MTGREGDVNFDDFGEGGKRNSRFLLLPFARSFQEMVSGSGRRWECRRADALRCAASYSSVGSRAVSHAFVPLPLVGVAVLSLADRRCVAQRSNTTPKEICCFLLQKITSSTFGSPTTGNVSARTRDTTEPSGRSTSTVSPLLQQFPPETALSLCHSLRPNATPSRHRHSSLVYHSLFLGLQLAVVKITRQIGR